MNITDTITAVDPVPDQPKDSSYGPTWWIGGRFKSGASFSRGAKSADNAHKLHATLTALIGTEGTFEVKDKGEFRGNKNYGLDSWPGKEERPFMGGGGSGKAPYQPRYRDTEEGLAREQRSIHRSVALERAVETAAICKPPMPIEDVVRTADIYFNWLSQDAPPAAPAAPAKDTIGEPRIGTNHPALKEMASYVDSTIGYEKKRCLDAIAEAVKANDMARLDRMPKLIMEAVDCGTFTLDEASELDLELTKAKKVLASGQKAQQF